MNLAAGVALLFAIVLLGIAWAAGRRSLKSRVWIPADGEVTWAITAEEREPGNQPMYRPDIQYAYRYQGEEHLGTQVHVGDFISSNLPGRAQRLVSKYRPGSKVTVYVNPDCPDEALLERGLPREIVFFGLAGLACLAAAVWLLV